MFMNGNTAVKNKWFWTIIVIIVVLGLFFMFKNDVKAKKMGIDVKYLDDPKYCEQDSDCDQRATCNSVNIYKYGPSDGFCKEFVEGSNCVNNKCFLIPYQGGNKS